LQGAIERPAGSFRGRGTPGVLRLIEIMGIEQARQWGVCTMNEFRKFLGLKRLSNLLFTLILSEGSAPIEFKSFEEWNPDPEIAVCQSLSSLY
jgi:linoleate 10R-lipoxygenase